MVWYELILKGIKIVKIIHYEILQEFLFQKQDILHKFII
jgi:hypothetical protein